jgi:uncharacterized protein
VFFSVKDLEVKQVRFDVAFQPGEIDFFESGLRQAGPLQTEGGAELLANTLGEIRVRGRVAVLMESDCDRCLEPARFPIESDFDLFYRPAEQRGRPAEEVEIHAGEIEIAFYQGAGLDLKDILREHILLSMPMQRICREDCLGICPACGQDRNAVHCGCAARPTDDRWSALKKLSIKGT